MLCLLSILATLQMIKMKIQARSIITNKNTVGSLARRRVPPRTGLKRTRPSHPYIQSYDHYKQRYTMMRTWYQATSRCYSPPCGLTCANDGQAGGYKTTTCQAWTRDSFLQ